VSVKWMFGRRGAKSNARNEVPADWILGKAGDARWFRGNRKGTKLANLCSESIGEAAETVAEAPWRIGNQTRLVFSSLQHCGLNLCLGPIGISRGSLGLQQDCSLNRSDVEVVQRHRVEGRCQVHCGVTVGGRTPTADDVVSCGSRNRRHECLVLG
jgi:hypothetical protein